MQRTLSTLQRILQPLRARKPCTTNAPTEDEQASDDMKWLVKLFESVSSVDKARILADRVPGRSAEQAVTLTTWLTGNDRRLSTIARILLFHFLHEATSAPDSQSLLECGTQFEEDGERCCMPQLPVQQAALMRDFLSPRVIRKSEAFQSFSSGDPYEKATFLVREGTFAPEMLRNAFYYLVNEFKQFEGVPATETSTARCEYTVNGSQWVPWPNFPTVE